MDTAKAQIAEFGGLKDLKALLSSSGPCVSLYLTLGNGKAQTLAWKELLRSVEPKLQQAGPEGKALLDNLLAWDVASQAEELKGKSIAVFRAPDAFYLTSSHNIIPNQVVAGPQFYIRPLLPELTRAKVFYILALSQKNVRLLRCAASSSEEVALPTGVYTTFDSYMNTAKPDHNDSDFAVAGPSAGHTRGVGGSTSTVREDKGEYLTHFFKQIDRGVNELLRNDSAPLVLAAVEYELAEYRTVNSYQHLAEEDVRGAPNSLKGGEMHARALEALDRCYDRKIDELLAEYNHRVGAGGSNRLKDVVTAAHDGRVLTLLISDSLQASGAFEEETHSVKGNRGGNGTGIDEEDLVNDAAVQTALHAGQVYVAPNNKMPNGSPVAAVFRY